MNDRCISEQKNRIGVPIKDASGQIICTVYYDPTDTDFVKRYQKAAKTVRKICRRLKNVSINADGSPASLRDYIPLSTAEREIRQAVRGLLPMDNEAILDKFRPFASVKGTFYYTHVLNLLAKVIEHSKAQTC